MDVSSGRLSVSFELASVLVRFSHVARFIVNAMISTRLRREREKKERELLARAPL